MTSNLPLTVTARLQQGVVLDTLFGTALDGLLASLVREQQKVTRSLASGTIITGSLLDGGLSAEQPTVVDLPLARCTHAETEDWHWMATTAFPLGLDGNRTHEEPDVHHHHARLRERTAEQVTAKMPASVPPAYGRYRLRRMPVVATPAAMLAWQAVGDPAAIAALVKSIPALGSRRGTGEGTVLEWVVTPHPYGNPDLYGHCHPDGTLGRPTPLACMEELGMRVDRTSRAGIRPPYWHHATQRHLALPPPLNTHQE